MGGQSKAIKIVLLAVGVLILAVAIYSVGGRLAGSSKMERARSLYEAGDEKEAYRIFETIYNQQPHSKGGMEALYYLCRMSAGSLEEKIACWEKFLDGSPSGTAKSVGMLELAGLYRQKGEEEKAAATYNVLIQATPPDSHSAQALYELASLLRERGDLEAARTMLRSILERHPDTPQIGEVQEELGEVNIAMLLNRKIYEPLSMEYVVEPGDSLQSIAKEFNTTVDLLKVCNNKKDATIRVNDRLKVVNADFSILIDKSQCTLALLAHGELIRIYSVGTGKDNVTPVGTFKIINKIVEPVWYRPGGGEIAYGDPENLLGTRWMGIDSPGYGIHGTWEPETVGKQSSAGCVRLLNEKVEELFAIVPLGTPITIVD